MKVIKSIIFGATYIINRQVFKKETPLIAGLTLTNRCNLRCRQCRIPDRDTEDLNFLNCVRTVDI